MIRPGSLPSGHLCITVVLCSGFVEPAQCTLLLFETNTRIRVSRQQPTITTCASRHVIDLYCMVLHEVHTQASS